MTRALSPDDLVEAVRLAVARRFSDGVTVAGEVTWAAKSHNGWRFALGDVLVVAVGPSAGALDQQVGAAGRLVGRRVRVVGAVELGPRRLTVRASDLDLLAQRSPAPRRLSPPRQAVAWPERVTRVALVGPDGDGLADASAILRRAGVPTRAFFAPSSDFRATVRQLSAAAAWGDVVLLVRGGGDLAVTAFDDDRVVAAISECPKPVVTGIGHVRDRTLVDRVAAAACATPTAAAMFVVQHAEKGREQ
jgi:hypothetical protein